MIDIGEQYFKGVLAGYLGANFTIGPITEWQIDVNGDGDGGQAPVPSLKINVLQGYSLSAA